MQKCDDRVREMREKDSSSSYETFSALEVSLWLEYVTGNDASKKSEKS